MKRSRKLGWSTLLFGLLALSDQPALRSIGLVSSIGIVLCVVLALSTGALFAPARERT